jgi:pimeloyl-ACP methyl ester carboxylesterase
VFFFQIPRLPEEVIRAGDFALLRSALRRDPVRPGTFTAEDIERYAGAMARPGALTATLNYYRALLRNPRETRALLGRIEAPVLVIWGERDRFLSRRLAEPPPSGSRTSCASSASRTPATGSRKTAPGR